jgi:hypothetical protein
VKEVILKNRTYLFALLTLALLWLSSCASKRANLQLEPEPRAISRRLNMPAARHPRLALDPAGDTVYVLAVAGADPVSQLVLLTSVDGGDTFEQPVPVNEPGSNVGSHGENSPLLLFGPGEKIYTMWEQQEGEATNVMFASSLDFGATFEKPVRISDQPSATYSGYPTFAVGPNKTICAAWLDFRDQSEHADTASIYLSCSIDEGSTFSKNLKVADGVCPCCRPNIVYGPQGQLMVFWRRVFPGNIRDMVVSISNDQGNTFAPPVRVAEDNWKLEGCPDSGPAVIRVDKRVYVAWLTEASPARSGVRLAWTDDGGKTFSLPVMASAKTLDANHPSFALEGDGQALLTFQARDPWQKGGWTPPRPYAVEIDPHGDLSDPVLIANGTMPVEFPTVATGNAGRVYFTWTESTGDRPAVMMLRARNPER